MNGRPTFYVDAEGTVVWVAPVAWEVCVFIGAGVGAAVAWCFRDEIEDACNACAEGTQDLIDALEEEIASLEEKLKSIIDAGIKSGIGEGYIAKKTRDQLLGLYEELADLVSKCKPSEPGGDTGRSWGECIGGGGLCFRSGTLIATEDGLKEIQLIYPGTKVWSYNHKSKEWVLNRVTKRHENMHSGPMFKIVGERFSVTVTGAHRFWVQEGKDLAVRTEGAQIYSRDYAREVKGRWVRAENLRKGDCLLSRNSSVVTVLGIHETTTQERVYNLSVEGIHNYSVHEAGILVHNVKP